MLSDEEKEQLRVLIESTEERILGLRKEKGRARFLNEKAYVFHLDHQIEDLNDVLRAYRKRLQSG